jgi:hypothetical protein
LSALFVRTQTNRGQKVETSLLETQVATLVNAASSFLGKGVHSFIIFLSFFLSFLWSHFFYSWQCHSQTKRHCSSIDRSVSGFSYFRWSHGFRCIEWDTIWASVQAVECTRVT